ncbi:hypothetical protein STIAU_8509 [Stigmatella aurantiaca DW4/3-1]|uniref:Uncharacterized protein n=1 Tax=Stigmatella aurantiaca (strain DW4/3-1) TaxID=378806 RepID=Q09AR8_STIAD|nr:hypothetical protein STIAU_8509 [Stigmatella aurantiaca DW4/3-1]
MRRPPPDIRSALQGSPTRDHLEALAHGNRSAPCPSHAGDLRRRSGPIEQQRWVLPRARWRRSQHRETFSRPHRSGHSRPPGRRNRRPRSCRTPRARGGSSTAGRAAWRRHTPGHRSHRRRRRRKACPLGNRHCNPRTLRRGRRRATASRRKKGNSCSEAPAEDDVKAGGGGRRGARPGGHRRRRALRGDNHQPHHTARRDRGPSGHQRRGELGLALRINALAAGDINDPISVRVHGAIADLLGIAAQEGAHAHRDQPRDGGVERGPLEDGGPRGAALLLLRGGHLIPGPLGRGARRLQVHVHRRRLPGLELQRLRVGGVLLRLDRELGLDRRHPRLEAAHAQRLLAQAHHRLRHVDVHLEHRPRPGQGLDAVGQQPGAALLELRVLGRPARQRVRLHHAPVVVIRPQPQRPPLVLQRQPRGDEQVRVQRLGGLGQTGGRRALQRRLVPVRQPLLGLLEGGTQRRLSDTAHSAIQGAEPAARDGGARSLGRVQAQQDDARQQLRARRLGREVHTDRGISGVLGVGRVGGRGLGAGQVQPHTLGLGGGGQHQREQEGEANGGSTHTPLLSRRPATRNGLEGRGGLP